MDKACLEIRDLMALGADAEPNERIAIESHVSICAECARELGDTRSLLGNLALLREGDMPAGAAERIWRSLQSGIPTLKASEASPSGPGRRRPLFLAWSTRVAAMLVIGLSIGFTVRSIGWRHVESAGFAEDAEDSRPTFVSEKHRYEAGEGRESEVPSTGTKDAQTFILAPVPAIQHHLPLVDQILEQGVIRF
ncbi:MAG TPA: hypothetical protein VFS19_04195 [Planctomycetota bacterium]|nr:hypothetical protein [Planctomycetota bacterium]